MAEARPQRRPLHWIGSSHDDIRDMPEDVQDVFGFALYQAQIGEKHVDAKPMRGFGGGSVLEVVTDDDGSTCRAVYTVKFRMAVYVLDVFQKKSKKGIETPKKDIDRIRARLKMAAEHYREHYENPEDKVGPTRHNS